MKVKAKLVLPNAKELMKDVGLNEGGRVQYFIDQFVFNHSEPYLPGKHIHKDSEASNQFGRGMVIWNTSDANYSYEEKLMVDPITLKGAFFSPNYGYWSRPETEKIMDPQGRNLVFQGGGKRGGHWFDRMIEDEMDDLLSDVKNIIDGRK